MTNATGGANNYLAWQPPEDVFSNTVPGDAGSQPAIVDSARSDDGAWHHAALVFDRGRGTMTLFRDYGLVGQTAYTGVVAPTDKPIYIGGGYANDGSFKAFNGLVDNVRVTTRALAVGEFLRPDHATPSGKTIAWASFDNALEATAPCWALTDGVASAAAAAGAAPSYAAPGAGERVEDGAGNVLRAANLAVLSCATGVVKYAENALLPLVREMTVEFLVRAGVQTTYAGIVRCNRDRDSADVPVWGLSAFLRRGKLPFVLTVR